MLSEFTILPSGIIMDLIGPMMFTIFLAIVHCASATAVIVMSKDSSLLVVPFFGCGAAAHMSGLIAMRTVFVFDTPTGRSRWILICCTVFDCSAISTMIYYDLWESHQISLDDVFKFLAILGTVMFGSLFLLYAGFEKWRPVLNEDAVLKKPIMEEEEKSFVDEKKLFSYSELVRSPALHFTVFISLVSIYRIRYYLGIANYTLKRLHDNGIYLEALGYCFFLAAIFTPILHRILRAVESVWTKFHLVNGAITSYFLTSLIPILPVQLITFSLFVFARLFFFVLLNSYISSEFSEKQFGMVMGLGFMAAAIPGSLTYLIVDVGLKEFNGNFWVFDLMCILLAVPMMVAIILMKRHEEGKQRRNDLMTKQGQIDRNFCIKSPIMMKGIKMISNKKD